MVWRLLAKRCKPYDLAMAKSAVQTGQMRWDEKSRRWVRFSGRGWAPALYSLSPDTLNQPEPLAQRAAVAEHKRQRLLAKAVTEELMRGAVVYQQEPLYAVLGHKRPVSHLTHLLVTIVTLGLWSTVWLIMAIARREDRIRLDVDEWGNVWGTELPKA